MLLRARTGVDTGQELLPCRLSTIQGQVSAGSRRAWWSGLMSREANGVLVVAGVWHYLPNVGMCLCIRYAVAFLHMRRVLPLCWC